MAIKVVILFQQVTNIVPVGVSPPAGAPNIGYTPRSHIAGWTESVIWPSDDVAGLLTALRTGVNQQLGLLAARAAFLPQGADIVGVRLYQGGAGRGQSYAFGFPGATGNPEDIPQMALLMKGGPQTVAVTRRWTVRGFPDNLISLGEFLPTSLYANAIQAYFGALGNFGFYAFDPTVAKFNVLNVTTAGVVTINGAFPPFANNAVVTLNQTVDSGGVRRSYTGAVSALDPTNNKLTLANPAWPWGTTTGGKIAAKVKAVFLFSPQNCAVVRAVTRRVGRPFEQYRGRRSKKRRTQ
jgi:hypothetical protein